MAETEEKPEEHKTAGERFAVALDKLCWYYVKEYDITAREMIGALRVELLIAERNLVDAYFEGEEESEEDQEGAKYDG
jgi:hypothetical protein